MTGLLLILAGIAVGVYLNALLGIAIVILGVALVLGFNPRG